MGARMLTALLNTLMGMGTVFLVLIFISLVISLFKYIPLLQQRAMNRKKQKEYADSGKVPERPAPKRPILVEEEAEELSENLSKEEAAGEDLVYDGELVAVLMAAILAASGGAVSADKLVVRSIKRVKTKNRR